MNKLLDQEIYKDIIGYENKYQISNLGNVISLNFKRSNNSKLLKIHNINHKKCYPSVLFSKNNKIKRFTIHRLLGLYFIPNPLKLKCINHKDGNKSNYALNNLEWCTHKENTNHAFKTGLMKDPESRKLKIRKKVINVTTNIIYESAKEASLQTNMKYVTFIQQLSGIHKNKTNFKYYIENEK